MLRSINRDPKPLRYGAFTTGPLSCHRNRNRAAFGMSGYVRIAAFEFRSQACHEPTSGPVVDKCGTISVLCVTR